MESSYRPAGGSFPSTGAKLSGTDSLPELPELAVDAEGNAYAVWTRTDSSTSPATHNLEASARPAGGSFATPVTLESVNGTTGSPLSPQVAADGLGDAAAVWTDSHNSTESVLATGYDGAGPQLRNLSVPSRGTVGHPLGFSVSPVDVWSSPASTRWNFGDGSTANGASVIHTYNRAGIFNVSVTSTDSLGNSSTATGTVTVPAGPSLSSVSMLRRVFAVGPKPTAISARAGRRKAPRGTAFRYRLSAPATVRIEIRLQLPGRKTRRGCVKPTRKLRHKQKCSRYVTVGTLIRHDPAGANSTAFSGRIGRRALRPGSYLAILAASNAAGVSQPKRLSFRIVRA